MTNILLVPINDLVSHPTETRFISIGRKLVEKFDVNLFVLRYKNLPTDLKASRKLNFQMVDYYDVKMKNIGLYYTINSGSFLSVLLRKLKQEKIDLIIHANLLPSTIVVGLGKLLNIPLIFDYQDHFPESAANYYKNSTVRSLAYSFTSQINDFNIKHSDQIVTVTDSHRKLIKKIAPHKPVTVIPNGVDTNLFRPIPRSLAISKLNLPQLIGKKILLYFGSIDSWLDFSTIFIVIKRLLKRGLDVVFMIVGYSHNRYFLEELKNNAAKLGIGDRVLFLPPVIQSRLVYYINAADVTIAPYKPVEKNQAVSLKILESLACGRPVCSTRVSEIVNRFKGTISLYSNERDLESILLQYLTGKMSMSPEKMTELVKEYSWDNFASIYYNIFWDINIIMNLYTRVFFCILESV